MTAFEWIWMLIAILEFFFMLVLLQAVSEWKHRARDQAEVIQMYREEYLEGAEDE